ncbi:hypothetical protein PQR75_40575 [Paraburkholderia fungorum]|uniref:hypothetical protein n=1 Tax=Paraburkholderia fungorum TaxID=134537 RepID=UPI0038B8E2EE
MKCGYRGWIVDATPDFTLGKFFARARLVRVSADDEVDGEMHIERDLSYFDTEDEAIEVAQHWAFAWICEHDGSDDNTRDGTSTSRSRFRSESARQTDVRAGVPANASSSRSSTSGRFTSLLSFVRGQEGSP